MNGIIHKCARPEGAPENAPPIKEEKIMDECLVYIDMLVNTVKPRKLLYLAVDGVLAARHSSSVAVCAPPFLTTAPALTIPSRPSSQAWRRAPR